MRTVLAIAFILLPWSLFAQVTVHVTDDSGDAVAGALISCKSGFQSVTSDAGRVRLPEGSGACNITHVSFEMKFFDPSRFDSDSMMLILERRPRVLPAVTVEGFQEPIRLNDVAGGYSYIDKRDLSVFAEVTPVTAFNNLAGVRMEQRSPSSYRINIRGSTLRSPFGIRNVKVYWNRIPLTEPTGNTPLNMFDLTTLGNIEIIRGPSGSIYGAGTGGVLLFDGDIPVTSGLSVDGGVAVGSFGMSRFHVGLSEKSDNHALRVSLLSHEADGYRDHSSFSRQNLLVSGSLQINDQQKLGYHLLYGDLDYQFPGGLTAEQRDENPQMARPVALSQNSSLDQKYLFAGLEHEIDWASWNNHTAVFMSSSNKKNPFITNYEFEDIRGAGLRTRFSGPLGGPGSPVILAAGGEWQWGRVNADNFGNDGGVPDTVRYIDQNRQFTGFEFIKLAYHKGRLRITAAGSLNHLRYRFNRTEDAALDSAYRLERTFNTVFSPRIGIVYDGGALSFHASYSEGFSPPVLDEVRTSDAVINTALNAEEARTAEIGIRGRLFSDLLALDMNLFYMQLDNTIVSQIDENGTSTFFNSGSTSQRGLELLAGWKLREAPRGLIRFAYLQTSVTWYHFRFSDYEKAAGGENVDFSGNELTGTPPLVAAGRLETNLGRSLQAVINYQHVSAIPLNDANTVYSKPYDLVQLQLSWKVINKAGKRIELYGGVDNLLDQSYSLGNDLNAFGSRYFNPAPTRNYFAGMRFRFGP